VNKQYALEWIQKAYHDLNGAKILYKADHYTDTIGYLLQQSMEKVLKSFFAYENKPILKTHNLIELYELLNDKFDFEESEIRIFAMATTYSLNLRYPTPHKPLPSKDEIKEILDFSESFFDKVCNMLDVDNKDII